MVIRDKGLCKEPLGCGSGRGREKSPAGLLWVCWMDVVPG